MNKWSNNERRKRLHGSEGGQQTRVEVHSKLPGHGSESEQEEVEIGNGADPSGQNTETCRNDYEPTFNMRNVLNVHS